MSYTTCLEENQLVDVLDAARGNVRPSLLTLPVYFLTLPSTDSITAFQ